MTITAIERIIRFESEFLLKIYCRMGHQPLSIGDKLPQDGIAEDITHSAMTSCKKDSKAAHSSEYAAFVSYLVIGS